MSSGPKIKIWLSCQQPFLCLANVSRGARTGIIKLWNLSRVHGIAQLITEWQALNVGHGDISRTLPRFEDTPGTCDRCSLDPQWPVNIMTTPLRKITFGWVLLTQELESLCCYDVRTMTYTPVWYSNNRANPGPGLSFWENPHDSSFSEITDRLDWHKWNPMHGELSWVSKLD